MRRLTSSTAHASGAAAGRIRLTEPSTAQPSMPIRAGHDFRSLSRRPAASETSTPRVARDDAQPLGGTNTGSTTLPPTANTTYDVAGATLADVAANLPADEAGNVHFAINVTGTTGDPITTATVNVTHRIELPRWTGRDTACPAARAAWDSFLSALRQHEAGHIALSRTRFAAAHTRFTGVAQSDLAAKIASETQAGQDEYDNYDASNNHGLTGTPPTILDTTVVCPLPAAPKTSDIPSDSDTVATKPIDRKIGSDTDRIFGKGRGEFRPLVSVIPTRRIQRETPPVPAPAKQPDSAKLVVRYTLINLTFTEDEADVRSKLEDWAAKNGTQSLLSLASGDAPVRLQKQTGPGTFEEPVAKDAAETRAQNDYAEKVLGIVRREVGTLYQNITGFRDYFENSAVGTAEMLLKVSETQINAEKERYGAKEEHRFLESIRGTKKSAAENADTAEMATAASGLLATMKTLDDTVKELDTLGPAVPLAPGGVDNVNSETPAAKDSKRLEINERIKVHKNEYDNQRHQAEGKFPVLVAYNLDSLSGTTRPTLTTLATAKADQQGEMIAKTIFEKLENIQKTREGINGDHGRIWHLDRVIEITQNRDDIKKHPLQNPKIQEMVVRETKGQKIAAEEFVTMALGAVALGLGLLAAPLTAGGSIVLATAATTGAEAVGVAMALQSIQQYQFNAAANGTDFDKAKAISQEEPDIFWVALDILTVGLAVKGVLGEAKAAFSAISNLRKEALAAKALSMAAKGDAAAEPLSKYASKVDQLEQRGEAIKPGDGKRLRQEVENSVPKVADGEVKAVGTIDKDAVRKEVGGIPDALDQGEHELKIRGDGRLERCSDHCPLFAQSLTTRADKAAASPTLPEELKQKVAALKSRAAEIGQRATAAAVLPDAERAAKEVDLMAQAKSVEMEMLFCEKQIVPEALENMVSACRQAHGGQLVALGLDEAAVNRILVKAGSEDAKNAANAVKGQLLEEMNNVRVRGDLAKANPDNLEFIEGHRISDANGRQFTDGVLLTRDDPRKIVKVFEAKAGEFASKGLQETHSGISKDARKLIEDKGFDLRKLESKELIELRDEAIDMSPEFSKLRDRDTPVTRQKILKSAENQNIIRQRMLDRLPPEPGQVPRDLERAIPNEGANFTELRVDGKPTEVTASRSETKVVGVTSKDVDTTQMAAGFQKEGLQFESKQIDIQQKQLDNLSKEIADTASKNRTAKPK